MMASYPGCWKKTLERGWRAVVRARSRERAERIDAQLWTYRDESFLPHSASGDGAGEPIWITDGDDAPNDPQILFLIDGAAAEAGALGRLERCVMIFDGRDDEAVADARKFWTAAKDAGFDATYWKQSAEGRWEKQG